MGHSGKLKCSDWVLECWAIGNVLERCELRLWSDFSWRKLRTSALNVATICVSNISEPKQESQRLAVLPPYVGIFLNSCKSLQTFPASACGLQLVNALAKNFLCRLWSLVALYFLCLASQALEPHCALLALSQWSPWRWRLSKKA
jgi:hypothetical protein